MKKYIYLQGSAGSLHAIDPVNVTRIGMIADKTNVTYISFTDGSLVEVIGSIQEILVKLYVSRIPRRSK